MPITLSLPLTWCHLLDREGGSASGCVRVSFSGALSTCVTTIRLLLRGAAGIQLRTPDVAHPALQRPEELAAAERVCAAGLARSREAGDLWNHVGLLPKMAILDLRAGRAGDAAALLREALQIAARPGARGDALDCLDRCGYLCAATGRCAEALTTWAASTALFRQEWYPEAAPYTRRRQEPLRKARQTLGPARARAAEERGAAMSLDTAAEYALMLTAPGPQQPQAPPGIGKLSAQERELVTLIAQGRTDAQIAAQLYFSVRAVRSHLDRIRDKTGRRRRADLTRLALSAGLV